MNIPFTKMHAQGNDFAILDKHKCKVAEDSYPALAADICDRHFGLGADGLVILDLQAPSMEIFNADGSRAEMCGSALRCCCYLLSEFTGRHEVDIHTDNGLSHGKIAADNPLYVTVEIGKPELVEAGIALEGFTGDYINIGNPHFVILSESIADKPHLKYGRKLSEHTFFSSGANVEFVRIMSRSEIELVVWERGVGETLACGTGSASAVFSGRYHGLLEDEVTVNLPGGKVTISATTEKYLLGGIVTRVASGEYLWKI